MPAVSVLLSRAFCEFVFVPVVDFWVVVSFLLCESGDLLSLVHDEKITTERIAAKSGWLP